MEHKEYLDIERFKESYAQCFNKGDYIIIQEKIDGANSSFEYNEETNEIESFSRNKKLDFKNTNRGCFEYCQRLDKSIHNKLNYRVFGEWLVSHSVPYPQEKYNQLYVFDIYNTDTKEYLTQDKVKEYCQETNLNYVPTFYDGEFISWEHCLSFVGKTELGGEYGEGIVIKNMTRLNDPNNRLPFYVKIVGEKFSEKAERKIRKPLDSEILAKKEYDLELAKTIITKPRITKTLYKMIDEGILIEDWCEKELGIIAKNISNLIYHDCVKEENDTVVQINEFGKLCSSISMGLVKEILKEKQSRII